MKRLLSFLIACLVLIARTKAQGILSCEVLSAQGGSATGSFGQYDYTIGQVVQETIQFPGNIVSQGLQQPAFGLRYSGPATSWCNGDSVHLPVEAIGFRSTANVFVAELSDASGGWATPLLLASATGTECSVLHGRIPFSLPAGSNYRIRVRSSIPNFKAQNTEANQVDFCVIRLKVDALVEGMHQGGGTLVPLLYNLGLSDDSTACDTVTASIMYAAAPFNAIWDCTSVLHTDGTAYFLFPSVIYGPGGFYLRLRQRNGLEVWSKTLVTPDSPEIEFSFRD